LNWAAFTLGQKVATGALDADQVNERLRAAAERAGLPDHEAGRTIRSGLDAGQDA
jgi:hypothetical protein